MTGVGFEFPVESSGEWNGFNDPGMEHFTGNRLQHLGREVPQNTIDAKVANPAKITVHLIKVPTASLPDIGKLTQTVRYCLSKASEGNDDKALKFFRRAEKTLMAEELQVLQIRDANTTGLTGPCVYGKPFFAMLKATGQSQKSNTSTGSYGIGKFAPFVVSDLRTVFVSTVWADGAGVLRHYVQGKSVLMSHLDDKGQTRRGTGFWGVIKGCQPVTEDSNALPGWLRMSDNTGSLKDQNGTMLSIIGFEAVKGWQNILAANIAESFFGAISRHELEVEIKDGLSITADTLTSVLSSDLVRASIMNQPGEPERFENVACYLRALQGGDEVQIVRTENLHLGTCELRVLVGENLPKKVAVLRNGMLITERLPGLKRFSDFKEFAAVLECTAEKGLALLRAMEPPRHDAFEPDHLSAEQRSQGRTALRELADWVRKKLVDLAKDPVSDETNLDELADYFGYEEEEGEGKRPEKNPSGRVIITARAVKLKGVARVALGATAEPESDDDGDDLMAPGDDDTTVDGVKVSQTSSDNQTEQSHPSVGSAPARRTLHSGLAILDVRAVPLGLDSRRVAFTPTHTGHILIELQDSGTDTNHALGVAAASLGTIEAGRITGVEVQAGKRVVLDVKLNDPFEGTLRIVTNAV